MAKFSACGKWVLEADPGANDPPPAGLVKVFIAGVLHPAHVEAPPLPCVHRTGCGCNELPGCAIGAGDRDGGAKCSVTHLLEVCRQRVKP